MKNRNPIAVILLTFITFGIYSIVWEVKTKNEMNRLGADIPTAWLIIIPLVNLWWLWKYCEGVEKVTNNKLSGILAFVLVFLLGVIGMAIIQFEFNKVGDSAQAAAPEAIEPAAPGFGPETPATPAEPATNPVPAAPAEVVKPVSDPATAPTAPVEPTAPASETPQTPPTQPVQ